MASRGRTLAAALALCALSVCAFGAVSAAAAELTAVTCKEAVTGTLDNHCTTGSSGKFETVALPLNTKTEVESKNTEAEPTLRLTLGGVNTTVICENGEGVGASVTNKEPVAGKHTIEGTGMTTLSKCHAVVKSNEARYCAVEGIAAPGGLDMISTVALKGTSLAEHKLKLEPQSGTVFAEFKILPAGSSTTEASCWTATTLTVRVEGSLEGEASTDKHSHATLSEANNGTNLIVGGAQAKFITTLGGNMKGEPEVTVGATTFT